LALSSTANPLFEEGFRQQQKGENATAMNLTPLQSQQLLVLWLLLTASTTADTDLTPEMKATVTDYVAGIPGASALFSKYLNPHNQSMLADRSEASSLLTTFLNSGDAGWGGPQCPRGAQFIINMFENLPG
jgi:hypothetical protein